jgi:WD40 repeat protein
LLSYAAYGQQIEIAVQKGHSGDVTALAFNQDGSLLASAGVDHLIKLWHIGTGKEMASFPGTILYPVVQLQFISDGDFLIVSYEDGSREKWSVITSSLVEITRNHAIDSSVPYVSSDKSYSIEVEKFYLRKRNILSNKVIFSKVPIDISKKFRALAVSESFNIVLAANEDGTVYAYNLHNGKSIDMLDDHYASVNAICFSPNNVFFATGSADRSIIIWDTKTLHPVRRLFGKSFRYEALSFNHAGNKLVVGDELGFGRIIDLQSTRIRVSVMRWHEQKISAVSFSNDDSLVYSGGYDNRLSAYHVSSGKVVDKTIYKHYFSAGDFFLKQLGVYREPYAWINTINVSTNGTVMAMGGAWRESAVRKSLQPITINPFQKMRRDRILAHRGTVNDVLFLDEDNFLSASPDLMLNWKYDRASGKYFFRNISIPGVRRINRIFSAPDHTVLLQSDSVLIHYDVQGEKILDSIHVAQEITAAALNAQNGQLVYAMFNTLVFSNLADWHTKRVTISSAHSDKITSIDVNNNHPTIATCSWDATIKLWNADEMKLMATIISIGLDDHIIITPDNYYYGTRNSLGGIGFKYGKVFISPEQYDLRFNRPDIILDRMGFVPKPIIKSFNRAYLKRLQKLNFTEEMLSAEIHMPSVELISDEIPLNATAPDLAFKVKAADTKYNLDRINVFINNVPVFGLKGISIRENAVQEMEKIVNLSLSAGRNKIQVSCLNEKGVESLMKTFEVTYKPIRAKRPNLHLAVISVSDYANPAMKLKYARKDGQDLVRLFQRSGWYEKVIVDTLYDQDATIEKIQQLRSRLSKTGVEDEVILFVSGHGLLDVNLDFYFATYDLDFKDPAARGLRYEELEGLLDGIPARKKLLLIDACHSGEVDKSRIQQIQRTADLANNKRGTVTTYTYPADIEAEHYKVGITTSFELMQEIFSNVSKGSGAVVIAASAGNSYALESDQWRNGVFTFALLNGVNNKQADKNKDGIITVSEIKEFVSKEVEKLTDGDQRPTSRTENLEFDFRVW